MKVRTEMRRSAILSAAIELFKEKGYERASMNELARRLGGSKATLYGYFPSKETLFVAVVKAVATGHLSEAAEEISGDALARSSLRELLLRFGERMMVVLTNDASALTVYRMVVGEAGHSNVGQLFHDSGPAQLNEAVAALFARAIERGDLRPADPKVLAAHFTALVTSETGHRLYQIEPVPMALAEIRQMVSRAVDAFLLGAASRRTEPGGGSASAT
jgi:AcrR family transcriptional regulator